MGNPYAKKGWRVFDLNTQMFFVSRDVIFSEEEFCYVNDNLQQVDLDKEEDQPLWAPISPSPIIAETIVQNGSLPPTSSMNELGLVTDPV